MIDIVLKYFKENKVKCKKVVNGKEEFIAIFGYGGLTRSIISNEIKNNDLLCMFFEGAIRKDCYDNRGKQS